LTQKNQIQRKNKLSGYIKNLVRTRGYQGYKRNKREKKNINAKSRICSPHVRIYNYLTETRVKTNYERSIHPLACIIVFGNNFIPLLLV
jgi:hypothetical protein